MNVVIYTAVTGDYDIISPPKIKEENIRYVAFMDKESFRDIEGWESMPIDIINNNARLTARYCKIFPYKLFTADCSIWIDGRTVINGKLSDLVNYVKDTCIAFYKHRTRNCVYKESKVIIKRKLDNKEIVLEQMDKYRKEKYPIHNGMVETGCIVRNHNHEKLPMVMESWWEEIEHHSCRDQLSINYAMWKHNISPSYLKDGNILRNSYTSLLGHKYTRNPYK